jgi:hypothetical protein
MKTTVQLESKDVRLIIAKYLGLPIESVIPLRYGFAITDMSADEIAAKLR